MADELKQQIKEIRRLKDLKRALNSFNTGWLGYKGRAFKIAKGDDYFQKANSEMRRGKEKDAVSNYQKAANQYMQSVYMTRGGNTYAEKRVQRLLYNLRKIDSTSADKIEERYKFLKRHQQEIAPAFGEVFRRTQELYFRLKESKEKK